MRLHLFEFEDLSWFPNVIREGMTDYLRFIISKLDLYAPIVPLIKEGLDGTAETRIIDLCSGGGGGIVKIWDELNRLTDSGVQVTLTDKYPNLQAFEYIKTETRGAIDYVATPLDAARVPESLKGFRTIFSSFHHFSPSTAKSILQDAVNERVPIGIFEGAEKRVLAILGIVILTPIIMFLATPFMKPFRLSRLFFTYVLPIIPICTVWDGVVSMLRIYGPDELMLLAKATSSRGYVWKSGKVGNKIGTNVIYLIGHPEDDRAARGGHAD